MQMSHFLGQPFGSYRLVREIARGGFGTVYQAQHTILTDRFVAIKVLHDLLLNSSQEREAFLQEAQLLERLKHPFILPLLDVGIQQNIPFLVIEYAALGSLRTRLQAQAPQLLAFQETLTLLSQVGQALQYAHQQSIIHRDLKPDNILFNQRGEALLADFGIATILSTASIRYTSITGTPAYMAPEQFQGHVSRETDQYSLGCIAYELFTGRKPFTAPDFIALGFKHATEQPLPPRQLNPSIPEPVERAILQAMAKERNQRYPDVMAFITVLQSIPFSSCVSPGQATQPSTTHSPTPVGSFVGVTSVGQQSMLGTPRSQKYLQPSLFGATRPKPSSNRTKGEVTLAILSYLSPIFLLAYPLVLLIIYLFGQKSHFARFHLMQATLLSLIVTVFEVLAAFITFEVIYSNHIDIGSNAYYGAPLVGLIFTGMYVIFVIIMIIQSLRGQYTKFPLIGDLAEKFANRVNK